MSATKKKPAAAAEQFEDFAEQATTSMKDGFEKMSKGMTDVSEFSKENFDAVMESATHYAKGVEEIAADNAAYAKASVEKTVEQFKAVSALKTPQEFIQAQTDFVRTAFESNLAQMQKVADAWTATAKSASEPLNKRYTEVVEKAQSYRF
ncbi:MAG: phasin family protein [Aquisalinus sp.]|nr:phasin family protein [Aquisalinus sp.]